MADIQQLHAKLLSGTSMFTIEEARQYVADVRSAGAMWTDKRFEKLFLEEFWPLAAIAKAVGDASTCIVFKGAGAEPDAELLFGSYPPQVIEFTTAIDGEQEALRDEHLALYGHAPVTAKLRAEGTRASGRRTIADTPPEVWSGTEQQQEALILMEFALEKKRQKAHSRPRYHGAWLGIVVVNFPPTEHKQERYDLPALQLLSDPLSYAPFGRVFVISTVGDYLFDSVSLTSTISVVA